MTNRPLSILLLLTVSSCTPVAPHAEGQSPLATPSSPPATELDPVADPPAGVSLLLLSPGFDRDRLIDVVEQKLGGTLYQMQGARLAVVQVPENADAILGALGMQARFERAVDPSEIPSATIEETRFVAVFSSRFYPGGVQKLIQPKRAVMPGGVVEGLSQPVPPELLLNADPSTDFYQTPFASGTIVVALLLPESNGVAEPSTEDWTEDLIEESYAKVETALEAYVRAEPNARLRFIVHYESSPGHGGLPGTIDSDYEVGKHSQFSAGSSDLDERTVTAPLLARLLGHDVTADSAPVAAHEYIANLKAQYGADGGYIIKISPNANLTAGFRPHSYIGGPWNALDTGYGFNLFQHETGHIFGALDEYCTDICLPTTYGQGYLGIANANAKFRLNGDGIDHGNGENAESLMNENDPDAINGYTRGAWGWLDSRGDGLIDVRNTFPLTNVTPTLNGNDLRVNGTIVDRPEGPIVIDQARSFNHIVALEYHLADDANRGDWFSVPVHAGATANVSLDLGPFPAGRHVVGVRARNSVGNTDKVEQQFKIDVGLMQQTPPAPRVRVDVSPLVGSVRSIFTITAVANGYGLLPSVQTRIDADGDGVYETAWKKSSSTTFQFAAPGIYHVTAQAQNLQGDLTTASTDVYVLDRNAPPAVSISGAPTVLVGQAAATPSYTVSGSDPDGDAVEYDWLVDGATIDNPFHSETGFAASNTQFSPTLPTPTTLDAVPVDLTAGDAALAGRVNQQLLGISTTVVASAGGDAGLLFTNLATPTAPAQIANLQLEPSAQQMVRDGNRLYVLGDSALTAVDVTNPLAPAELKQKTARTYTHAQTSSNPPAAIPDGGGIGDAFDLDYAERITAIEVDAEVVHAQPKQLTFSLQITIDGNYQSYILRDQVSSAGGDKIYKFTDANTPALAALVGHLAHGEWVVTVADDVAGVIGTFQGASLTVKTESRAFQTLPGSRLVGVLPNHQIVVAGAGLQVIDAKTPTAMSVVSSLTGTGAYSGVLRGTTALVLAPPLSTGGGRAASKQPPQTQGLYAVDLSAPSKPVVLRQDTSFGDLNASLSLAGSRAYLCCTGKVAATQIFIDVPSFAANNAKFVVGSIPSYLPSLYGDNTTIYGASDHVQAWTVSRPSAPVLAGDYPRPGALTISRVDADHAMTWDGTTVYYTNVHAPVNILSRTYRVTLQARDSQGAITTQSRTAQVIPYDHPPAVTASLVSGSAAGDDFVVRATVADPDQSQWWGSMVFGRADFDGDGIYESGWGGSPGTLLDFDNVYTKPGTYTVGIQIRDQYFAFGTTQLTVVVK